MRQSRDRKVLSYGFKSFTVVGLTLITVLGTGLDILVNSEKVVSKEMSNC